MKARIIKEKLFYIATIGVSILLLFFVITCSWISHEAKNQCQDARREYLPAGEQMAEFDCVEALISLLEDEDRGFRARNNAIWGLGQFGDSRALPVLKNYYTGNIPDREPLDEMISQYELKKAINLVSGGFNISAFIWRGKL
ncbi:MAG: HEAT repeat domain-containing protein [Candidatus Shapirobacteria bacterium]|nr:HEAT repeat domain-containing protein [Candidatus Shapirobacteria bacterium]